MQSALEQADAAGRQGEVPVGAVLVAGDGAILGRSCNRVEAQKDPTAHAEVLALRHAAAAVGNYRLEGTVLVVTLEPCMMCAGALVHARIAGLVYGAADARAGAVSSCLDGLDEPFHNHRVWHMGGVLGTECAGRLQAFFEQRR
ncbi:tRNA adenosine(34) deaminase TadA [Desulfovibrio sp. OttesenSCG-928-G15]|nr:tRNA adenosine(34) deaminase TadA [Desulfovibrio sp. OttesenSCG-928-G15]